MGVDISLRFQWHYFDHRNNSVPPLRITCAYSSETYRSMFVIFNNEIVFSDHIPYLNKQCSLHKSQPIPVCPCYCSWWPGGSTLIHKLSTSSSPKHTCWYKAYRNVLRMKWDNVNKELSRCSKNSETCRSENVALATWLPLSLEPSTISEVTAEFLIVLRNMAEFKPTELTHNLDSMGD